MSNVLATYNLASQKFDKDLDITELKVSFQEEKIKAFSLKGSDTENNINYSLTADIEAYGENSIEELSGYKDASKDELLETYLTKLRNQEYKAEGQFVPSKGATNINARTFRVLMAENGNICSVENYKKGSLNGTMADGNGISYNTTDNKKANVVKIGEKYYQNGEETEGKIYTPSFEISSIFFKRKSSENNVTVFELNEEYSFYKDTSTDNICPLFTFTNLFGKNINESNDLLITIDETANSIKFECNLVYSYTSAGSTHITYTFDKENITVPNKEDIITDISKSTWKDLFAEKTEDFNGLVSILGSEDNLNKLPIPSSKNPVLGLTNKEKEEDSEYPSYSVISATFDNVVTAVEEYKAVLLNNNFVEDPTIKCYWGNTSALKLKIDDNTDLIVEFEDASATSKSMNMHVYLNLK